MNEIGDLGFQCNTLNFFQSLGSSKNGTASSKTKRGQKELKSNSEESVNQTGKQFIHRGEKITFV